MASSIEHTVTINLQCPVCLELLNEPKQLSCTHTFCKKCLRGILSCSSQTNENIIPCLQCPICRTTTYVTNGKVENLSTNVPIKSLVDDVRNSQQFCDMCDSNSKALHFCCECGKYMCNICLKSHNRWPNNLKHRVVRVEDIKDGKVVLGKDVYCLEHQSESRKRICTDVCITCKKFICERCRMFDHGMKCHIVQSAEEYNASTKAKIESLQSRVKIKYTNVKNHMTCIASQKGRTTDHLDRKKAEINKIYRESLKELKKRKATLDKQLETKKVKLCARLDEMKDADERLVVNINSASLLAVKSLKGPLDDDTIAIHDSLSGALRNVLDRDNPKEKLATDVVDHAEKLVFTQNYQNQLNIGEVQSVKCELKYDEAFSNEGAMNAVSPTPDGRMAVGYADGGIDIFSADGKLHQTLLKDVGICCIEFLSSNRNVLLDGSNTIIIYTKEWARLDISFGTLSDDEGGIGNLTVDSNDLIYVSYTTAKKIQVFSPEGGPVIREIPCDGYKPVQITSYRDLIIVTDFDIVRMIDKKSNVKHMVQKAGVFAFAAVTQSDSILIAWVNDDDGLVSIDEYTNELKHIKTLISDKKN